MNDGVVKVFCRVGEWVVDVVDGWKYSEWYCTVLFVCCRVRIRDIKGRDSDYSATDHRPHTPR